jgi:hypothetical protein
MKTSKNSGKTWSEILRKAVFDSGKTQYRLATDAKIGETQLARFIGGKGLNLSSAERLGAALGLTLKPE